MSPTKQIIQWFRENKREFPWREVHTPYAVWISEVMLQQTRASVVVGYFHRWMMRFPNIEALALAEEGEVIKLWEGLGYYSRARNILMGSRQIMTEFGGEIPDQMDKLLSIQGIGLYTAGAILSFAFKQKAAALDGNVMRVLARYFAFERDVTKEGNVLRQMLLEFLPEESSHLVMEGLIELGALVCQKTPLCHVCPLAKSCLGKERGLENVLPIKPKRRETITLYRFVACIENRGHFLVSKNKRGEIMADLWEFPYLEAKEAPLLSTYQKKLEKKLRLKLELEMPLPHQRHSFTHYRAHLFPFIFQTESEAAIEGYEWVEKRCIDNLPFSSGHRKISNSIQSLYAESD